MGEAAGAAERVVHYPGPIASGVVEPEDAVEAPPAPRAGGEFILVIV